jgi:hypothetical protein
MKIPFFILCILLFIPAMSFSQKINFKNLIGIWQEIDTASNSSLFFKFIDSSNGVMTVKDEVVGKFIYSINTSRDPVQLLYTDSMSKKTDIWLIKFTNSDTLKIQSSSENKIPGMWDNNETYKNTGLLVRRKN